MADPRTSPIGIGFFAWIIVFTVICTAILLLRFWAARIVRRSLWVDDYLIVLTYLCAVALSGTCIWSIFNGMGKHVWEVTLDEFSIEMQATFAAEMCWVVGTTAVKLSILWLQIRVFQTDRFRRWAYALMALSGCYIVVFLPVFLTTCAPVSYMWNRMQEGYCNDWLPGEFAAVGTTLAIDALIMILPMPWLWTLQMPVRNKVVVTVTLCIGVVTIAVMGYRINFTIINGPGVDVTYNMVPIDLITLVELWLGIIIACIPTLAPLLRTYVKPLVSKLSGYVSSGGSGSGSGSSSEGSRARKFRFANFSDKSGASNGVYTETIGSEDAIHPNEYGHSTNAYAMDPELGRVPSGGPAPPGAIHVKREVSAY